MRSLVITLMLFSILIGACSMVPASTGVVVSMVRGPRADNLLIKIYETPSAELSGFEATEIDILDFGLPHEYAGYVAKYSIAPWNETILLTPYIDTRTVQIDINHNETLPTYPNWSSPTSCMEFRRALAHLADKNRYVSEVLGGYGVKLDTLINKLDTRYYNPEAQIYSYDPAETARLLDAAGFTVHPDGDWRVYPPGHAKAGQKLDPLVFYVIEDVGEYKACADMFYAELVAAKIPVDYRIRDLNTCFNQVEKLKDYHLFLHSWGYGIGLDPEWMYYFFHSSMYAHPGSCWNYNHINDTELDFWLEKLDKPQNATEATTACKEAQKRLQEIVGVIPLYNPMGYQAHNKRLLGTLNLQRGCATKRGIDNWLTFLTAHFEEADVGGTIRYGKWREVQTLNPVYYSGWGLRDWEILDKCYEFFGVILNPYTLTDQSWAVKDWTFGTWTDPATEEKKTKLTFQMYDNLKFHDGTPVTSEDVKFSYDLIRSMQDSDVFWWISNGDYSIRHVETPNNHTITVYYNVLSYWTLYMASSLPILPKHIWNTLTKTVTNERVGTGDGTKTKFWLDKNWKSGFPTKVGTEKIYLNGTATTAYTMEDIPPGYSNYTKTGKIIFDTPPPAGTVMTADYIYYDWHGFSPDPTLTGSGPWKFVEYMPGEHVLFTANREYFMPVHPKGDLNFDMKVDIYDIVAICRAYGSQPGDGNWYAPADIAPEYQIINIYDAVTAAAQYGHKWQPDL